MDSRSFSRFSVTATFLHVTIFLFVLVVCPQGGATRVEGDWGRLPSVGREVTQELMIDNPYHEAGIWGKQDMCIEGAFAYGVNVKFQSPGHLDETAVNGIQLRCLTADGKEQNVTSSVGAHGDFLGIRYCSRSPTGDARLITGFRANVLAYQGKATDDVAVEDIEVDCDYGREILKPINGFVSGRPPPKGFNFGEWSSFAICRDGSAVCGIQTRYEAPNTGDDTAINDFKLFCCSL